MEKIKENKKIRLQGGRKAWSTVNLGWQWVRDLMGGQQVGFLGPWFMVLSLEGFVSSQFNIQHISVKVFIIKLSVLIQLNNHSVDKFQ